MNGSSEFGTDKDEKEMTEQMSLLGNFSVIERKTFSNTGSLVLLYTLVKKDQEEDEV